MRKIFSYLPVFFAASLLMFTACEETERAFPEITDVETGAIARRVGDIVGEFDFENIDGSQLDFTVEFFDSNNGKDVASYSWAANYNGEGPVALKSFDASSFSTNDDGLPQVSITITFSEVLDAFGLDQNGIVPGQAFDLQATITMNDGRTFTAANTQSNLQGQPVYLSTMAIRQGVINVPCFSQLSGVYDATSTGIDPDDPNNEMAPDGWGCGTAWSGTVTIEALHDESVFNTGTYVIFTDFDENTTWEDPSFGAYYTCYGTTSDASLPNGEVRLKDDCGFLFWEGVSQWGEAYFIQNVTVSGADLTIEWYNDYGEAARTKLTRTDGTEWPELFDGDNG